jgi:hypothetical protein
VRCSLHRLNEIFLTSFVVRWFLQIPKSLNKPGGYDHRDALFGIPPYGGSIQLQVYYSGTDLCEEKVDNRKGYPARDTDSNGIMEPWKSPFVLMVDRGNCTFVQKVRKAQHAGAAGVLIADNVCQCFERSCIAPVNNASCEVSEPIMSDDGSGADVTIPSFLIFKQDADPIRDEIMKDQQIRIEMAFSIPAPDSRVEYDIFLTPMDPTSQPILKTFRDGAVALGKKAFFTPHMYFYDGRQAGCHFDEARCFNLCTNHGRYCAMDPDDDLNSGVSGGDIVKESLRRICIWNNYGKDGIGKKWWDYSSEFIYRCADPLNPGFFTSEECVADAMAHAGVDKKIVDSCMSDTGGLEGDVTNSALEKELVDQAALGAVRTPVLFVNQAPVLGSLSFSTVFKAICAGYAPGSEPSVCKKCASCPDEAACVKDGRCPGGGGGSSTPGISIPAFVVSLALVSVVLTLVGMIQYRRQQRHMHDQVRGILAEYMPLDENQKHPNDTSMGISDDAESTFTFS